jgi:hypothetical protein
LARSHAFGDLHLRETGRSAALGELAGELASLERGRDPQLDIGIVHGKLVDERPQVVMPGHRGSLTHI